MERVHEKLIFLTVYSIKYCDSKSYTYLISKRSENLENRMYMIFDVHFHSFHPWDRYDHYHRNRRDPHTWKLKNSNGDSFSLFSSPRFTPAVERPSRLLRRKTHPSPSNAARTSFFLVECMYADLCDLLSVRRASKRGTPSLSHV